MNKVELSPKVRTHQGKVDSTKGCEGKIYTKWRFLWGAKGSLL